MVVTMFGIAARSPFRGAALVLAGLAFAVTSVYAQERYAVLVGVGEYVNLAEKFQLQGPPNDAQLAREYLLTVEGFDVANVFWLADDAPLPPTRANILAAFDELDRLVQAGDFVLLHLSGHGSRQPAVPGDPDEHDGYDEIFLPADAADWDDSIASVRNAITDNELGAFISSYRNKGADVWLVVDSCHAGTMARGAGDDDVVERFVDPYLELDVPQPSGSAGGLGAGSAGPSFVDRYQTDEQGMLVAFSAAHSSERAPEMRLPRGDESGEIRGLLSHNIFTALGLFPGVSYRQLAQLVTSQYAAMPWTRSTPQFYGTDMDRVVFNASAERATLFAAVRGNDGGVLAVDAGVLRGFDVGAEVAIYGHAHDSDDNVAGVGRVVSSTATNSEVEPVWADGVDVSTLARTVYARLTVPAYETGVTISLVDTKEDADNRRLREIAAAVGPGAGLVEFVEYRPDADYFAAFFDDRFWLLTPGQSLPCEVKAFALEGDAFDCIAERDAESLFWAPPEAVEDLVTKAARVRTLTKLEGLARPSRLAIDVQILTAGMDAPESRLDRPGPLYSGDEVYFSVHNRTRTPWDVFFFYVASNLRIQALQAPGQSVRVLPGERIDDHLGTVDASTVGTESMVIIADPVARIGDGVEADYWFLEQDEWVRTTIKTVGEGGVSAIQGALESLWEQGDYGTRGFGTGADDARIRVFTWTVERSG